MPQGVTGGIMSTSATGLPPWVAPMVGGITNAAKGLFGWIGQRKQNKIQREYEQQTYEKNKRDQLDFWHMQNEYNSPQAQMQRLKDAGLNPNLVYGNGADAISGNLQAPSPSISNSTRFENPITDANIFSQMANLSKSSAQIDLMRQQTITQESIQKLNSFTALLQAINTRKGSIELGFLPRQLETAIGKTLADIENVKTQTRTGQITQDKLLQDIQYTFDENIRQGKMNDASVDKIKQDIAESLSRTYLNIHTIHQMDANIKNLNQKTLTEAINTAIGEIELDIYRTSKIGLPVADKFINILFKLLKK